MASRTSAYVIALLVFITDQLSKWLVVGPLKLQSVGSIPIAPFFALTYTENRGISGGLFHASDDVARWGLVAATAAIAIAVATWIWREKQGAERLALALVLGGALGNIADRARLGYVVDFADLHLTGMPPFLCMSYENGVCRPFLIFNVGDAAISIGVALLLLGALIQWRRERLETQHA